MKIIKQIEKHYRSQCISRMYPWFKLVQKQKRTEREREICKIDDDKTFFFFISKS